MFRSHGLRAWRKGTVGQLEAGLRKPRLDEVLLMARALSVTLDKLIPGGDDERIELGDNAEVSPRWIREMLTGDFYRDRPLEDLPYEQFPVDELMADALIRSETEKKRVDVFAQPILEWAKQHDVKLAEGRLACRVRDSIGYRAACRAASRCRHRPGEALGPRPVGSPGFRRRA